MNTPEFEGMHYSEEDLAAWFAGEMADDEADELESHLGQCAECQAAAEEPNQRALAWSQWTPAAHREAIHAARHLPTAVAAPAPVVPISGRKSERHLLPVLTAAAGIAAGTLLVFNLREGRALEAQARRIADLEARDGRYGRRVAELQAEVAQQSEALAALRRTARAPDRPDQVVIANAVPTVTLAPLSLEAADMGEGKPRTVRRDLGVLAPAFHLPLLTPGNAPGTRVEVVLTAPDAGSITLDLAVEAGSKGPQVVLTLTDKEAKPFLNRPARLTARIPGHASLGTVMLTLEAQ